MSRCHRVANRVGGPDARGSAHHSLGLLARWSAYTSNDALDADRSVQQYGLLTFGRTRGAGGRAGDGGTRERVRPGSRFRAGGSLYAAAPVSQRAYDIE